MLKRPTTDMVKLANTMLSGWGGAYHEAMRPAEGEEKLMTETRTVKVRCVYKEPDDGVSHSWVKVDDRESYGGTE